MMRYWVDLDETGPGHERVTLWWENGTTKGIAFEEPEQAERIARQLLSKVAELRRKRL